MLVQSEKSNLTWSAEAGQGSMSLRAGEEIRFKRPCRTRHATSVSSRTHYGRGAGAAATALGQELGEEAMRERTRKRAVPRALRLRAVGGRLTCRRQRWK